MKVETDDFLKKIEGRRDEFLRSCANSVTKFGGEVHKTAVLLTPVDSGDLRGSSYSTKATISHAGIYSEVGYERDVLPENAYSVYVHERTELHHEVGEAKFLEHAMQQSEPKYLPYLRQCVKRDMGL